MKTKKKKSMDHFALRGEVKTGHFINAKLFNNILNEVVIITSHQEKQSIKLYAFTSLILDAI